MFYILGERRCLMICQAIYKPVCGSDGKTYGNECDMRGAACIRKEAIIAVRQGECPSGRWKF